MRTFYPEIEPFQTFRLPVSDIHELYVEQVGNPNGQPVVFLHGGPGAGISSWQRRFFDPEHFHIILFDQRGAGKSTPHACLEENTTWDLVGDIEKIREHLNIQKWIVFGGSWGSTLALTYAQTYPGHVTALALRGIFLCRHEEIQWFYQHGAHVLYPDQWEHYIETIPMEERNDMVKAYYKYLTHPDPYLQMKAAKAWSTWEGSTLKLIPSQKTIEAFSNDHTALSLARTECHYFVHNTFFEYDDYLLKNVHRIRHIPAVLVHGRYDVVCPVKNAWDLHKAWPESKLEIIADAGHAADEPGIVDALIRAMDSFKD